MLWRRDVLPTPVFLGFSCGSGSKESTLQCGRPGFDPWVGEIPWRRAWQLTPVFLPGESHGQRSLAGYSPQGHKESDMTEQVSTSFYYAHSFWDQKSERGGWLVSPKINLGHKQLWVKSVSKTQIVNINIFRNNFSNLFSFVVTKEERNMLQVIV